MPDGRLPRQPGQPLGPEDIGDVPHLFLDVDLRRARRDDLLPRAARPDRLADVRIRMHRIQRHRGDPRALLPAVLESVEP